MRRILESALIASSPAFMLFGVMLARIEANPFHPNARMPMIFVLSVVAFALAMVMALEFLRLKTRYGSISTTMDRKQNHFIAGTLLIGWFALMALSYSIDDGQPHPSSVAGVVPWMFQDVLGPQGLAGAGIRAEFARAMAALPPIEVWQTRAMICLASGILGMALYSAVSRRFTTLNWAAITTLGIAFSVGAYQSSKMIYPVAPWVVSCESFTRAAGSGNTLTTGDMRTLELRRCPLPLGFQMERATRTATAG